MNNEIMTILNANNAFGPDKAMKRSIVLICMAWAGEKITDRKMRDEIHKGGAICKCEKGYYLPRPDHKREDVQYCAEYLKKKIFPLWKYIKDLEGYHLDKGQIELGFMDEANHAD